MRVVSDDVELRRKVRRGHEPGAGLGVRNHSALAPPPEVVVLDAAHASDIPDACSTADAPGATILVAPEIDDAVREQGRRLDAAAYVRNDEGLDKVIGLVIELVAFTG